MHSEPKQSRALVSKKRLPQLKRGEKNNEVELKNKSVAVDITHTSKEAQSTGRKMILYGNLYHRNSFFQTDRNDLWYLLHGWLCRENGLALFATVNSI